jgi:hypothetical protein
MPQLALIKVRGLNIALNHYNKKEHVTPQSGRYSVTKQDLFIYLHIIYRIYVYSFCQRILRSQLLTGSYKPFGLLRTIALIECLIPFCKKDCSATYSHLLSPSGSRCLPLFQRTSFSLLLYKYMKKMPNNQIIRYFFLIIFFVVLINFLIWIC